MKYTVVKWHNRQEASLVGEDCVRIWGAIHPVVREDLEVLEAMTVPELALVRQATRCRIQHQDTAIRALSAILQLALSLTTVKPTYEVWFVPDSDDTETQTKLAGMGSPSCLTRYGLADLDAWVLIHETAHMIQRINSGAVAEHGPEFVEPLRAFMDLIVDNGAMEIIEAAVADSDDAELTLPDGWEQPFRNAPGFRFMR